MTRRVALSVDFGQGFTNAWNSVVNIVPKLVAFAVIMFIGWIVARLVARVLDRILRKIGFERVAEKGGMSRALQGSQYDTTGIISKVVYYAVLLMTLQMGFGVFGTNPVSTMLNSIVSWLPKGLVAIVIVVVAMAVARAVKELITSALGSVSYGNTLGTIAWAFIVLLGAFAALGQAGIATSVTGPLLTAILATIAGVVIVGVGGGLITPMRSRWDKWLDVAERETTRARANVSAYQKGHADAMTAQPAETAMSMPGRSATGMSAPGMPTPSAPNMPNTPNTPPYGRETGTTS